MDWLPAIFGLAGAVIGALASIGGAAWVQRHDARATKALHEDEREQRRIDRRGESLSALVDALAVAIFDDDGPSMEETRAINLANMQFRLSLAIDEQEAAEYAIAVTRLILREGSYERRVGTLNYAIGVLTSWHRGLDATPTTTFEPFRYIATSDDGAITVTVEDGWG